MKMTRDGVRMIAMVAALALGTTAHAAPAAQPNCRTIGSTSDRLACYDAAFPPVKKETGVTANDTVRGAYKDPFLAEEAKTAAKLRNICRGC